MPLKALCLLLLISMFMMGCFTQSESIKGEPPPDESNVRFHLLDRSYIKSPPGNHHRLDNGYQIRGEIVKDGMIQKNYDGVVHDNEIERVTVERLNTVGTIGLAGAAVVFCIMTVQVAHVITPHD